MWVGGRVVRRRSEDSTWRRDPPSLSPQAGEGEPACKAAEAAAGGGGRGGVQGPGRSPEAAARARGCHRVCRVHEPGGDHAEEPAPVRLPRVCVPSLHPALLPHLSLSLHPPYPSVPVPLALSLSLLFLYPPLSISPCLISPAPILFSLSTFPISRFSLCPPHLTTVSLSPRPLQTWAPHLHHPHRSPGLPAGGGCSVRRGGRGGRAGVWATGP